MKHLSISTPSGVLLRKFSKHWIDQQRKHRCAKCRDPCLLFQSINLTILWWGCFKIQLFFLSCFSRLNNIYNSNLNVIIVLGIPYPHVRSYSISPLDDFGKNMIHLNWSSILFGGILKIGMIAKLRKIFFNLWNCKKFKGVYVTKILKIIM